MRNYQDLLNYILDCGSETVDRTGVGTIAVFGETLRWNLEKGFPATTCKELKFKGVVGELLWFLEGSTNVERLRALTWGPDSKKRTIWDDNYENQGKALGYNSGYLGPVYGKQWRDFAGVDQLKTLISGLQKDLETGVLGRRHIVSAWNPAELPKMALPPCHVMFQCKLRDTNRGKVLDLLWFQRSVDSFLGLPYNIASYALLTHILAKIIGVKAGELVFMGGDVHIYSNHLDQVKLAIKNPNYTLPTLALPNIRSLEDLQNYSVEDFQLLNYKHCGFIKAPMAV